MTVRGGLVAQLSHLKHAFSSSLRLRLLSHTPSPEFDINVVSLHRIDIIFGRVEGLVWEVAPFSPTIGP
jgi:hypothetical protein